MGRTALRKQPALHPNTLRSRMKKNLGIVRPALTRRTVAKPVVTFRAFCYRV